MNKRDDEDELTPLEDQAPVELSASEIIALEREKKTLLRKLRSQEPPRSGPAPVTEGLSLVPPVIAPGSLPRLGIEPPDPAAVQSAEDTLATLDQAIRQEEEEFQRSFEEASRAQRARQAALAEQRRVAADALRTAKDLFRADSLTSVLARRAADEAEAVEDRRVQHQATFEAYKAEVVPLWERAQVIHDEMVALYESDGETVKRLGASSWDGLPKTWRTADRQEYGSRVFDRARNLHQRLVDWIKDFDERVVPEATAMLTRYQDDQKWAERMRVCKAELAIIGGARQAGDTSEWTILGGPDDGIARQYRREVKELGAEATRLEKEALKHARPVIEVTIDASYDRARKEISEEMKQRILSAKKSDVSQQTHASGMSPNI